MLSVAPSATSSSFVPASHASAKFTADGAKWIANNKLFNPLQILVAGGIAGVISRTATAPMDRLKVLLQCGTLATGASETPYTGVAQGLRKIYQEGGWRAFFRGNGTNVIKIAPEMASKFCAFETLKQAMCVDPKKATVGENLVAGALAGMVSQALIYPLEITKTRLAVAPANEYKGIGDCLSKLFQQKGVRGLYRGLTPSLLGIVPYAGVDLAVYSTLKEAYIVKHNGAEPGVGALLACGAASSVCAQTISYPLQLVRTRLQAQGLSKKGEQYRGLVDCMKKTVQAEGVKGLYRGILPNFMKALPAISISYVVYESVKKRLIAP